MVNRSSSNMGSTHFSKILLSAPSVGGTPRTVCALVNTGPVLSREGSGTRWPLKPILAPSSAFKTRHGREKTILCAAWIMYNPKVQLSLSSLLPSPHSLYVSLLLSRTPLLSSHPFSPSLLLSSTPSLFFLSLTCDQVHARTHTHACTPFLAIHYVWHSILFMRHPFSSPHPPTIWSAITLFPPSFQVPLIPLRKDSPFYL